MKPRKVKFKGGREVTFRHETCKRRKPTWLKPYQFKKKKKKKSR